MSGPLPSALRARFQQYIEEGPSGRTAALRLELSPATGLAGHTRSRPEAAPRLRLKAGRAIHASLPTSGLLRRAGEAGSGHCALRT